MLERLFRFHKSHHAEATQAREKAEKDLATTRSERQEASDLAGDLRRMRENNHFAQALIALYTEDK